VVIFLFAMGGRGFGCPGVTTAAVAVVAAAVVGLVMTFLLLFLLMGRKIGQSSSSALLLLLLLLLLLVGSRRCIGDSRDGSNVVIVDNFDGNNGTYTHTWKIIQGSGDDDDSLLLSANDGPITSLPSTRQLSVPPSPLPSSFGILPGALLLATTFLSLSLPFLLSQRIKCRFFLATTKAETAVVVVVVVVAAVAEKVTTALDSAYKLSLRRITWQYCLQGGCGRATARRRRCRRGDDEPFSISFLPY